ncbi:S9 family peptidase [Chelatococcus reniformis]|uniref:Peptidase S9 n=1 Tax=Chelatococcus reniformis TaxID=1494448 RepID=A0A916XHJ4_9HYPH|nr:S9 family peptidase [Chelatococcus reniformis]GGC73749.1 peptidase S9 [Chelatococcus reniformis]
MTAPSPEPAALPPKASPQPTTRLVHGERLTDEFGWLRADNWAQVLKDPGALPAPIRTHLEAENAYCAAVMAPAKALRAKLIKEMRGRMKEDESSVPEPDGPFAYYERYNAGAEHPLVCRTPRDGGIEEVLLDAEALSSGKPFFDLGGVTHTHDHARIAYSVDERGSEYYRIRIRDLPDRDLGDTVDDTTGDIVWTAAGDAFYYVMNDDNHRPSRVFRHRVGAPQAQDDLIYAEADPGWFVNIDSTQSSRFLVIAAGDHETSESWLVELDDPQARPVLVAPRQGQVMYDVEHHGDRLIISTNADGAEDFKLVEAPVASPGRDSWSDLVPYRAGVMILSHIAFARHLVRMERQDARPRIVVRTFATGEEHAIAFDEEAYALGLDGGLEYDTDVVRFIYASLTTPATTYAYDMATRTRTLLKQQEVPSGHDPAAYVTRRLLAPAPDGALVPVSLLYRRGTPLDGTAPALVYGYGAYGSAMSASFRTNPLSLVDRGFIYAIAHVRGGTEKGWAWYLDGKRHKKPNTFSDFVAVCEHLVAEGFTGRGRIVAHGGSAGGMLMGAVANMAPALFAGIVADVPFVDVLNTMLDGELPLTPPEWPEWGNPGESRADFDFIQSYSPYDCIRPQDYPPILALGGLTDPRVTYWEPAKWVAKLRATMTGGGPILLHTNMDAGHGGAAGRFDSLKETALIYAFALQAVAGFD